MKSYLLFAILLACLCATYAARTVVPEGAPYQALARSGRCTGTANITVVNPVAGTVFVVAGDTPIAYGVDTNTKMFAFDLGAGGKQFTFTNGSYEYIPVPGVGFMCFFFPNHTFDYEKISKSTAVKVPERSPLSDTYFGLVTDAGAGFSSVAITIVEDTFTRFPRIVTYSQKLPKPVAQGQCSAPTLTAARLELPDCSGALPDASFFQLPQACLAPQVPLWTEFFCF